MKIMTTVCVALAMVTMIGCTTQKKVVTTVASSTTKTTPVIQDGLVPGEWTIYTVGSKSVTGDERPYITFDPSNSRFYGSNGCNTINGDFALDGANISLTNVISTMRLCPDAPFEYPINQAIEKVRKYAISKRGNENYMTLYDAGGSQVMVLRKHNMEYLNGPWQVVEIGDNKIDVDENPEMQLLFDVPELKVHGNTGCNIINGSLLIDPDKTDALQLYDLAITQRACHKADLETSLLLSLEAVDRAVRDGSQYVWLLDQSGNRLIRLKRAPLSPDIDK